MFGEQPDVFKQILEFYLKDISHPKVLDLTHGFGKLWRNVDLSHYYLIANDVDKTIPYEDEIGRRRHFHFPLETISKEFPEDTGILGFDAAFYDPPYKYNSSSMSLSKSQALDKDWKPSATLWTIYDQQRIARALNKEIPVILNPQGIFIVKIMNTRLNKQLILSDKIIIDALTNFDLFDQVVYIRTLTGLFVNTRVAQSAHGFYLIFKKKELVTS
jgi:hypothetical protein